MKYVKGFDTIRALAVFYVIFGHWWATPADHGFAYYARSVFIRDGGFGVNLFFVLSGFLISAILLNEKVNNTGNKLTIIKNFFVRRSLRIFPAYYLFITICYLLNYAIVRENPGYFFTYTSNLLPYFTNQANELSHTWTLSVEEQFYVLWPWLIIFINRKYLQYVFAGAIIVGVTSKYIVLYQLHHTYPVLVFNCIDSFAMGAWYAYIRLDENTNLRFKRAFRIVFPLMLYFAWMMSPFGGAKLCVMYYHLLDNTIAIALIMFAINNRTEWVRKYVMENRVLNFIGKISYGIYIYHFTFGYSFDKFISQYALAHPSVPVINNFYCVLCIKLVLLITICWLSFRFVEQPIMRLKKRFEYSEKRELTDPQ